MTTRQFSYALKSKLPGGLCLIIIGTEGGVSASLRRPGVVRDPSMHGRSLDGNREISHPTRGEPRVRIGKVRSRSR